MGVGGSERGCGNEGGGDLVVAGIRDCGICERKQDSELVKPKVQTKR